jgi:hypothetical protein
MAFVFVDVVVYITDVRRLILSLKNSAKGGFSRNSKNVK